MARCAKSRITGIVLSSNFSWRKRERNEAFASALIHLNFNRSKKPRCFAHGLPAEVGTQNKKFYEKNDWFIFRFRSLLF